MAGNDFSIYEGYLHTDHSIRDEFFSNAPEPPRKEAPWLMDFTYLYESGAADHREFVQGEPIRQEEIYEEIGPPTEWRLAHDGLVANAIRSAADVEDIARALSRIEAWDSASP